MPSAWWSNNATAARSRSEGNDLSSITRGGTSARAQASVLDLYDTTRLRHPLQKDGKDYKEVSTFDAFDKMISAAMASIGGKQIVLLTSTIHSPSTLQIISEFLAKYPGSRHVQYDAVSYSGMLLANEASYGKRALPSYHFDKAKTIVSLSADFLGTWLSPVEFAAQYAENRRVKGDKAAISRHFHFESMLSLTGSNADDRFTHKPSETGNVALALLAKLGGAVSAPSISDAKLAKGIEQAAAALSASKGQALVVCGSNDANIQVVVNAINELIGANGTTINWAVTSNYRKGVDADMEKLVADMSNGTVGAVMVYDCNPVYSHANGKKFGDLLAALPVSISFASTMTETAERCRYIIPSHHWLESWGDAEPKSGYFSLIQPIINPLFKTRAFQDSLLKWSGNASDYANYIKSYWTSKLNSPDLWDKALQDGVVETATAPAAGTFNAAALSAASSKAASAKGGAMEVILYEKVSMGDGSQANNPWLQELPDPVSKVTWDNYAMISPELAKTLIGIDVFNNQTGRYLRVTPKSRSSK
ncbi:MAG: hypothetical protein U0T56_07290 [Ferruginibacter sp.]